MGRAQLDRGQELVLVQSLQLDIHTVSGDLPTRLFNRCALGTVGHLSLAQAFRETEATAVLPLDFLRLIWASLLGFFLFAQQPDPLVWVGGAVIFSSTVYLAYREARLARTQPPEPPPS